MENVSDPSRDVAIACAADDAFAMPLAVTVASALDHLKVDRKLTLFILDGGLSIENRQRLEASWPADRLSLCWLRPSAGMLEGLPVSGHVNVLTYFRMLLAEVLPREQAKVIYLDSDLLVLRDLAELWDRPLEGHLCLAAPEVACPYMDASRVLPNYRHCAQFLVAIRPVPNYARLNIPTAARYFNAGVMVVDLKGWRQTGILGRLLQCLRENRRYVKYWDQYALNVVLAGCWGELDTRWNQGTHIFRYPSWRESPFDRTEHERIISDPYIVHFSSPSKPWHFASTHPHTERFLEYVDRTAWSGWRPERPANNLRRELGGLVQRVILYGGRKYRFLRAHLGV